MIINYAYDIATLQDVWNAAVSKWIAPIIIMVIEVSTGDFTNG